MNKLLVLLVSLSLIPALPGRGRAQDDDDKPVKKKIWGSLLKSAAIGVGADLIPGSPVTGEQVEGAVKTAKAFRSSAAQITDKEEYYIGRSVAAKILSKYPPSGNESLNRYVQSVLQSVAASSSRPSTYRGYHAQVLESDEINAMAAPGGFVFVTTGLLKSVKSEDQLACVLAHEVAHVAQKHGLKTIKASRLTKAFQVLGTEAVRNFAPADVSQLVDLFGGSIDDIVGTLVTSGYSREKEYEADAVGAKFAASANYDPGAMTKFLGNIAASSKGGGMLKTHPAAKTRIKKLEELALKPSGDYEDAPERQKRFAAAVGKGSGD
jgi:predicted Zn-dependent protease